MGDRFIIVATGRPAQYSVWGTLLELRGSADVVQAGYERSRELGSDVLEWGIRAGICGQVDLIAFVELAAFVC